jgi:uncharacterized membrane protein
MTKTYQHALVGYLGYSALLVHSILHIPLIVICIVFISLDQESIRKDTRKESSKASSAWEVA